MENQNPSSIIIMQPSSFGFNSDTASDNVFQNNERIPNAQELALKEHAEFLRRLNELNIEVLVLKDSRTPVKPDAIFLNNWFALLPNKQLFIFPMQNESRKIEVTEEHIQHLKNHFTIENTIDLRNEIGLFLEGTGSLIFDFPSKQVFASISQRTSPALLTEFEKQSGYSVIAFDAEDLNGNSIYHTNVLLSIGANIIVVCYDAISNGIEKAVVKQKLESLGRTIIDISFQQLKNFCANVFEVNDREGSPVLCMSETAFKNFTKKQIETISRKVKILQTPIPTIETLGGGSLRCMIAGAY